MYVYIYIYIYIYIYLFIYITAPPRQGGVAASLFIKALTPA